MTIRSKKLVGRIALSLLLIVFIDCSKGRERSTASGDGNNGFRNNGDKIGNATVPCQSFGRELNSDFSVPWVLMGPRASLVVRVATTAQVCPDIEVNQVPQPMSLRAPTSECFPVKICESVVSREGTTSLRVLGHDLPLPRKKISKIVVFGDSGCRLKGSLTQACNDPKKWPFAEIAAAAAELEPDLVIHVGDYLYRETPCPAGQKDCASSPYGDAWATWKADFFDPASSLLKVSPWIAVRGNHETCSRSAQGWLRMLSAHPFERGCDEDGQPLFSVDLGSVVAHVMDSASVDDAPHGVAKIKYFSDQLNKIQEVPGKLNWLLLHQPLWNGNANNSSESILEQSYERNPSLVKALSLILSGHIHHWEALSFEGAGPSQLIVGTGGTLIDRVPGLSPIQAGNRKLKADPSVEASFGFVLLSQSDALGDSEPNSSDWNLEFRTLDGRAPLKCTLQGAQLNCSK